MNIETLIKVSREIHIGRTCFPERRMLQHYVNYDRNYLGIIKWVCGKSEAKIAEGDYIKLFRRITSKTFNDVKDDGSIGAISGHWNCIYASFSLKTLISRIPTYSTVTSTESAARIWPDKEINESNIMVITTSISRRVAQKMVDSHTRTSLTSR